MSAREFFEAARDCVAQVERAHARLERMRSRLGPRGPGSQPSTRGGSADPSARLDAWIDADAATERLVAELERTVADALVVIDGVRLTCGERAGDILELRYVDGWDWGRIGEECGLTDDGARIAATSAEREVDIRGLPSMRASGMVWRSIGRAPRW